MPGGANGRPPKPAAIHKLNGNPGKRASSITEPCFPKGEIAPPAELPPRAARHWEHVIAMFGAVPGMLTHADRDVIFQYCMSWEMFYTAQEAIDEHGIVVVGNYGAVTANPAVRMQNAAKAQILQIAQQWGFTPVSRSGKVFGDGPQKVEDPFEALLRNRAGTQN